MTKPLSKEEKKHRRDERRKRKQQKPKSPTVKTINIPKPNPPAVNLCDKCIYEFGECDGTPKFTSENDDTVIECDTYHPVEDNLEKLQEKAEEEDDRQREAEEATTEAEVEDTAFGSEEPTFIPAQAPARGSLERFAKDETDYGACQSCSRPLKRTAYSRYVDAVRCTNPRCRSYREIVKTVPSGAK